MTKDGRNGTEDCQTCLKIISSNTFAIPQSMLSCPFYDLLVNPRLNGQLLSLQSIVYNQACFCAFLSKLYESTLQSEGSIPVLWVL